MELAVNEVALIESAVKHEMAPASLLAVDEIADELDLVEVPGLGALPMLLVVIPLALIHAAIHVDKQSVSLSLSVLPFSLIDVAVSVRHPSFSVEAAMLGLSMIGRAVGEYNDANTLPDAFFVEDDIELRAVGLIS